MLEDFSTIYQHGTSTTLQKKILWHPACDSKIDQFNRYESLINTRDGILDFVTSEVQDHSPTYCLLTSLMLHTWDIQSW